MGHAHEPHTERLRQMGVSGHAKLLSEALLKLRKKPPAVLGVVEGARDCPLECAHYSYIVTGESSPLQLH